MISISYPQSGFSFSTSDKVLKMGLILGKESNKKIQGHDSHLDQVKEQLLTIQNDLHVISIPREDYQDHETRGNQELIQRSQDCQDHEATVTQDLIQSSSHASCDNEIIEEKELIEAGSQASCGNEIIEEKDLIDDVSQASRGNEIVEEKELIDTVSQASRGNEIIEEKALVDAVTVSDDNTPKQDGLPDFRIPKDGMVKDTELVLQLFVKKLLLQLGLPEHHIAKDDITTKCRSNVSSSSTSNAPPKLVANVTIDKNVVAATKDIGKRIRHYKSSHKILLVGEGDFSFSACLVKAFGSANNIVTTSLDDINFLKENYASATSNIGYLRNRGGVVIHEVDATKMADHDLLYSSGFDRIIYNFPLAGYFDKSRKKKSLKRNRNLVRLFMMNAKELLNEGGEIHITHKTSASFLEWDLENLGKQCRLQLIEAVEFKLWHYPGYHTKYGFGGNEDFNCYPSRTYKFAPK